jgi:hypothetical protein
MIAGIIGLVISLAIIFLRDDGRTPPPRDDYPTRGI